MAAVLVSQLASSQLVMAMPKARGIVTDLGNIGGHMASLSREYMIPTILNLKNATTILTPGLSVTVDAITGRVYEGRVSSLIDADYKLTGIMVDTPVVSGSAAAGRCHCAPEPQGSQVSRIRSGALPDHP